MQKQRTAHRWRLVATIVVGTFLAFGSLWLLQVMQRGDQQSAFDASNEPDYIVDKFSFVRMTPEGTPRYLFYGDKLTHRPVGDVSEVESPIMVSMSPTAPPMTITARQARIRHQQNEVDLLGKVDIVRPPSPTTEGLRLKTEALTVYPDEERMRTDKKVQVDLGDAVVTGTGMQADNAARQIEFEGRGRLVVPPAAAR